MNESCKKSIETYKDYSFVMYVMCYNSSLFYSTIKNVINIPIIICTTALSILSSSDFKSINNTEKQDIIRYFSIGFNLLIALSIAILNVYKITEKEFFFNSHASSFMKINNNIELDLAKNKTTLVKIDILKIINDYNFLCENMAFHIPPYIRRSTFKKYHHFNLPLLLLENSRDASILRTYYKKISTFDVKKTIKEPQSPASSSSKSDISSYTSGKFKACIFDRTSSSNSLSDKSIAIKPSFNQGLSPIQSVYAEEPIIITDSSLQHRRSLQDSFYTKKSPLSPHPPHYHRNRLNIKSNRRHSLSEIYQQNSPINFSITRSCNDIHNVVNRSPISSLNKRHLKAFMKQSKDRSQVT